MFPFAAIPAVGGMMQGLLGGAGGAGATGLVGQAAGAVGQMGAQNTAGAPGIAGQAANAASMLGNGGGGGNAMNTVGKAVNAANDILKMPDAGGLTGGMSQGPMGGLMQVQAPGYNNDPLTKAGGMWQQMFGGGI